MFEQTFKNIDDILWKEAGCSTELDYTEQTSWLLFLKYLDDLEQERAEEAELTGRQQEPLIREDFRWSDWAAPRDLLGILITTAPSLAKISLSLSTMNSFPTLKNSNTRRPDPTPSSTRSERFFQRSRTSSAAATASGTRLNWWIS